MKKVIVFGTFDGLHKGHESFLNQAKNLGDYLVAVVARDTFVRNIKGKLPKNNEKQRVKKLRKISVANKVVLGSRKYNFYKTIRTYKINLIALGYDQKPTIFKLRKDLKRHRLKKVLVLRLSPYRPDIYKSSKINGYV